jgi:cytochrome c
VLNFAVAAADISGDWMTMYQKSIARRWIAAAVFAWATAAPALAAGDAERGANVYQACAGCHSLEPGRNYTGPSLAGLWGRNAGSLASFGRYSEALKRSSLVWNDATLDRWLRDPATFVPGNAMSFAGIGEAQVRTDLITFLRTASKGKNAARVAQRQANADLKSAPHEAWITAIRYCDKTHAYFVTNGAGRVTPYWEFNLRFKSDSSDKGPLPGRPVLVRAGMQGDKAQAVFSNPREFSAYIKDGC